MKKIDEYMLFRNRLVAVQDYLVDSAEEATLRGKMDDIWWNMTDAERDHLEEILENER